MARLPTHLDSLIKIDFTDIRIKKSILYSYRICVVYILGCNPVSEQSVEGLLAKNRGNLWRDCP